MGTRETATYEIYLIYIVTSVMIYEQVIRGKLTWNLRFFHISADESAVVLDGFRDLGWR